MAEGEVKDLKQEIEESIKNLRDLSLHMGESLKNLDEIKGELEKKLKEVDDKKIEELNEGKAESDKISELTEEQKKELESQRDKVKQTYFETLKKEFKKIFEEKQKIIEEEQEKINEVYPKRKQEEIDKTKGEINELEEKLKDNTLSEDDRKKLEKEKSKKEGYLNYINKKFDEDLAKSKKRITAVRDVITAEKQKVNIMFDTVFEKEIFIINKNKNRGDDNPEKSGHEEAPQESGQASKSTSQGGTVTGGNGQQQQPKTPKSNNEQQQQPQPASPQQQQPNSGEHQEKEIELFKSNPYLKYDGKEMSLQQALEIIKTYSELDLAKRKECLRYDGIEIVEKATEVLETEGKKLTNSERNLLKEYSKKISEKTKELVKQTGKKRPNDGKGVSLATLTSILDLDENSEAYKAIRKCFLERGVIGKKFDVLDNYDKLSDDTKKLLDKAIKGFDKQFISKREMIEAKRKKLKESKLTDKEKEQLENDIARLKEEIENKSKGFNERYADLIRAGKALSHSKKLDEIIKKLPEQEIGEDSEESLDLTDDVNTTDDILKNEKDKIEKIFEQERKDFFEGLEKKLAEGKNITLEEYYKYNQYRDGETHPFRIENENIDDIGNALKQFDLVKKKANDGKKLTVDELRLAIGIGAMKESTLLERQVTKFWDESTREEYINKYGLKKNIEKRLNKSPEAPGGDPVI